MTACTKDGGDLDAGKVQIQQPIKKPRKTANCHNCDKTIKTVCRPGGQPIKELPMKMFIKKKMKSVISLHIKNFLCSEYLA